MAYGLNSTTMFGDTNTPYPYDAEDYIIYDLWMDGAQQNNWNFVAFDVRTGEWLHYIRITCLEKFNITKGQGRATPFIPAASFVLKKQPYVVNLGNGTSVTLAKLGPSQWMDVQCMFIFCKNVVTWLGSVVNGLRCYGATADVQDLEFSKVYAICWNESKLTNNRPGNILDGQPNLVTFPVSNGYAYKVSPLNVTSRDSTIGNIFIFSFYTQGQSYVLIFWLSKEDHHTYVAIYDPSTGRSMVLHSSTKIRWTK